MDFIFIFGEYNGRMEQKSSPNKEKWAENEKCWNINKKNERMLYFPFAAAAAAGKALGGLCVALNGEAQSINVKNYFSTKHTHTSIAYNRPHVQSCCCIGSRIAVVLFETEECARPN